MRYTAPPRRADREQLAEHAVATEARLAADDQRPGCPARSARSASTATPMLPTCGALSKVEQHL